MSNVTDHMKDNSHYHYEIPGAITYIVVAIVVYSVTVCCVVSSVLRRRSSQGRLDRQMHHYIDAMEAAREENKIDQVIKTRLKLPGNFLHSAIDQALDNDSDVVDTFIEIPARTVLPLLPQRMRHGPEAEVRAPPLIPVPITRERDGVRRASSVSTCSRLSKPDAPQECTNLQASYMSI